MTKTNTKAGFSLVELMVVVAIIGILATIAVPNFQKFQAKAKQSSAKSELTGLYTAQKAFFAEYSTYHTNLPLVGYVPDGVTVVGGGGTCATPSVNAGVQRLYQSGFGADAAAAPARAADVPTSGSLPCTGATYANSGWYSPTSGLGPSGSIAATSLAAQNTFLAEARGKITSSSNVDQWNINENKALVNTSSGL